VTDDVLPLATQGALLGLSAAAQPGPFQGYLVSQSVRTGTARSLPLALVPLLSDPPVIAVVLLVLGQVPDEFVRWLGLAGGAVVLWLGFGAVRAALAAVPAVPDDRARAAAPLDLVRATLVNLTNPNAWLFWSLIGGPILTGAWRASPLRALTFLAGFYALLTGGNVALVLLAGRAAAAGPRLARALGVASGVALLVFGVWQLVRALPGS
jgi:threonine/homoserine/homoserine lactone efflux protein